MGRRGEKHHTPEESEASHALAMIALARSFGFFRRVMLLTATPHPNVRSILERLYSPYPVEPQAGPHNARGRVSVHSVDVVPVQLPQNDPVDTLSERLRQLWPKLQKLRAENSQADYIPAVVIVNSVVNAIRLEDSLVEFGFSRDSLAIIRGLSNRDIRSTEGKL